MAHAQAIEAGDTTVDILPEGTPSAIPAMVTSAKLNEQKPGGTNLVGKLRTPELKGERSR